MRRLLAALGLATVAASVAASVAAAPATGLPPTVAHALRDAGIPQDSVAVVVQEAGAQSPLLALRSDTAMNPASVMKLVTSFVALEWLGPAFTWKTEAYLEGDLKDGTLTGNLILKGYGDPKITLENF